MRYRECVNYSGGAVCHAGVRIDEMRDGELRLPCVAINGITGEVQCAKLSLPAVHASSQLGDMVKALELMLAGKCPTCRSAIELTRTLGMVTVAVPCGHTVSDQRAR